MTYVASPMQSSWKHDEVFPIIAHIIQQQYQQHQRYIAADEIAAQLLHDAAAKSLIEHAQSQQRKNWSADQLARNMVAWFSHCITVVIRLGRSASSARRLEAGGLTGQFRTRHELITHMRLIFSLYLPAESSGVQTETVSRERENFCGLSH